MKSSIKKRISRIALMVALFVLVPTALMAQDGMTIADIVEAIESLSKKDKDLEQRIIAIEDILEISTATPTVTSTPSETPTPTDTSTPTRTPTKTSTPMPTFTPTPTFTPMPQRLPRVSAERLFDSYKLYEGKDVEVFGAVVKKQLDRVELDVPGWFSYFVCWLAPDQENLSLVLKNRQRVVLQGESVSKESNTVAMKNCVFVSPSPVELGQLNATRVASTATARSVEATATMKAQRTRRAERATQEAVRATATATHRHQGFHCLSPWNGQSRQMNSLIKTHLNDPNSMEVHSTRIAPEVNGTHTVIVDFGAKNALGGVVRNIARGLVDHETCEALVVLSIEPK